MEEKVQREKQEKEHLDSIHKYLFGGPTLLSDIVDISSYRITPRNSVALYVGTGLLISTVTFIFKVRQDEL